MVDVYRAPPNKDMDGWRGPAKIVDASPETLADGIVHVRWGGRVLICRLQDVRKHIAFWSMFFLAFPSEWSVILAFIKTIGRSILHVGWLLSEQGWIVSKGARDHPEIFAQGTLIANMHLGLHACIGIRLGYGVATIPPLDAITYTMFVFWVCDSDEYQYMEWQGMRRLDASTAFGPLWHDTCWVQFLTVSDGDARNINEFGRQADEAMPEADAQMDVPDEDMEDTMPPGLPPRPPPPPAPAIAARGRSPPSLSPPRSRSRDLPSIREDPVSPP